jgi:hypothetical protein
VSRRPTRRLDSSALALGAAIMVGAVARLLLMDEPMRFDESYAFVRDVSGSFHHIVTSYPFPGGHFLHTLFAHVTLKVVGNHLWTARASALVAGVLMIPAVYLAARELYDRAAALWAAALTAGFAPLVDYSANGRAYILGVLFTVVALWLAARLLSAPRRAREWAALSACFVLAVYSVPSFAFAVATVSGWLAAEALVRRDRATLIRLALVLAASAGIAAFLYSPTFDQTGWDYARAMARAGGSVDEVAQRVWEHWNLAAPHPLDWLVIAGFVTSLVLHRRLARHRVPVALPALALALAVALAGRAGPFERSWLYVLPFYLIHAGAGLAHLTGAAVARVPRAAPVAGVAAIVVAAGLAAGAVHHGETDPTQLPSSDNHIVDFLRGELAPGEAAVLDPASVGPASDYYAARYHYLPPELPRDGRPTTALLVIRSREGGSAGVNRLLESIRWRLAPGAAPPTLVRRLKYIEAWRARVAKLPRGGRP